MQQHHYSAAELSGDPCFPSHLTSRQTLNLFKSHGMECAVNQDGTISAWCVIARRDMPSELEETIFQRTDAGMFRAAAILLWLGY